MGGKGKCVGVRAVSRRIFGLHLCPERLDGDDPSAYSEVSVSSDVLSTWSSRLRLTTGSSSFSVLLRPAQHLLYSVGLQGASIIHFP
jgi:hypothetical protein